MKREIEFRGQKADNKEWVYGYLVCIPDGDSFDCYIISDFDERDSIYDLWKYAIKVIPETVGQYIGITDKNGKKVYAGDIVKTEQGRIGNICFNDGAFCFNVENKYIYALCDSEFGYVYKENADELEVIGNIFDKESDK